MVAPRLRIVAGIILALVLAVPAVLAGLGGIGYRATTGDGVRFHVTAYDENGTIVYTSDIAKAAKLAAQGRTDLHSLDDEAAYEPYGTRLLEPGERRPGLPEDGLLIDDYLRGHREGDTVWTPYVDSPFGRIQKEGVLDAWVGPVLTQETYDRQRLEASVGTEREHVFDLLGSVEDPQVGHEFTYANALPARIVQVTDTHIVIDYDAIEGARVFSTIYGINFTVHQHGDDMMMLEADTTPGDILYTARCRSPDGKLRPGNYQVVSANSSEIRLEGVILSPEDNMLSKVLKVELEVVDIEGAGYWQRLGSYLSWRKP